MVTRLRNKRDGTGRQGCRNCLSIRGRERGRCTGLMIGGVSKRDGKKYRRKEERRKKVSQE
jgi:hypothetical protein